MLLYKAWRESRARFLWAAVTLTVWCFGVVYIYPALAGYQPYEVHVYTEIFDSSGKELFVIMVIFLGIGGLRREGGRHTAVFTLALPVGRSQLIGAEIAVGLTELAVLAILPALLIQPLSSLVHESYPIAHGFRFGLLRFICGAVIFATSYILSATLRGEYAPALGCYLAVSLDGLVSNWLHPYRTNLMRTVAARWDWDAYRPDLTGPLPWTLLSIMVLIAGALLLASVRITERQSL